MKNKKIILSVVITLMIVTAGYYILPEKIQVELPAVFYRTNDETYGEKTSIKFEGYLHHLPLFRQRFDGTVIIEKNNEKQELPRVSLLFDGKTKKNGQPLYYYEIKDGDIQTGVYGIIQTNGKFQSIHMVLFEPTQGNEKITKDLYLTAPATSREQAIAVANKYK